MYGMPMRSARKTRPSGSSHSRRNGSSEMRTPSPGVRSSDPPCSRMSTGSPQVLSSSRSRPPHGRVLLAGAITIQLRGWRGLRSRRNSTRPRSSPSREIRQMIPSPQSSSTPLAVSVTSAARRIGRMRPSQAAIRKLVGRAAPSASNRCTRSGGNRSDTVSSAPSRSGHGSGPRCRAVTGGYNSNRRTARPSAPLRRSHQEPTSRCSGRMPNVTLSPLRSLARGRCRHGTHRFNL